MNKTEQYKQLIESLMPLQEQPDGHLFPCPRCGQSRMDPVPVRNPISRYAKVYICSDCGADEATRHIVHNELPLDRWSMVISFCPQENADWSKETLIARELEVSEDGLSVEATFECWFDVDAKFGTDTSEDDDSWVNVYARYTPSTGVVSMEYVVDRGDSREDFDYLLDPDEEQLVISVMEDACQRENNCSLAEYVSSFGETN